MFSAEIKTEQNFFLDERHGIQRKKIMQKKKKKIHTYNFGKFNRKTKIHDLSQNMP